MKSRGGGAELLQLLRAVVTGDSLFGLNWLAESGKLKKMWICGVKERISSNTYMHRAFQDSRMLISKQKQLSLIRSIAGEHTWSTLVKFQEGYVYGHELGVSWSFVSCTCSFRTWNFRIWVKYELQSMLFRKSWLVMTGTVKFNDDYS